MVLFIGPATAAEIYRFSVSPEEISPGGSVNAMLEVHLFSEIQKIDSLTFTTDLEGPKWNSSVYFVDEIHLYPDWYPGPVVEGRTLSLKEFRNASGYTGAVRVQLEGRVPVSLSSPGVALITILQTNITDNKKTESTRVIDRPLSSKPAISQTTVSMIVPPPPRTTFPPAIPTMTPRTPPGIWVSLLSLGIAGALGAGCKRR
jgi:hypothetical protein